MRCALVGDRQQPDRCADGENANGLRLCLAASGVILNAYTVYYDLVLCDLQGQIVANGRPELYRTQGRSEWHKPWLQGALASHSGDEYTFQTAHTSELVGGEKVLIYACGVREKGLAHGRHIGALGILFNWEALGQAIVDKLLAKGIPDEEQTRCLICDSNGQILADTQRLNFGQTCDLPFLREVLQQEKGFQLTQLDGRNYCVAYARAPGFETYTTGWHCIIFQPLA